MTTNGRAIAASTPGSQDSIFYRMCNDKDGAFTKISRHHTNWKDAVEPYGPIKQEILNQIRSQYGEDENRWIREMEAEFAEDENTWIPLSLMKRAIDENHEYITKEEILALPDWEK
jgi:hypothetical protein